MFGKALVDVSTTVFGLCILYSHVVLILSHCSILCSLAYGLDLVVMHFVSYFFKLSTLGCFFA